MKTNKSVKFTEKTHEGAPAARTNAKQQDKSLQKFLFLYYDKKLTDVIIAKYISDVYWK